MESDDYSLFFSLKVYAMGTSKKDHARRVVKGQSQSEISFNYFNNRSLLLFQEKLSRPTVSYLSFFHFSNNLIRVQRGQSLELFCVLSSDTPLLSHGFKYYDKLMILSVISSVLTLLLPTPEFINCLCNISTLMSKFILSKAR